MTDKPVADIWNVLGDGCARMTGETPRVSVVIPAYNEGEHIVPVLDRIFEAVRLPCEVLVVVDSADDTTVPVVERVRAQGAAAPVPRQHLRARPGQRDQVRHRRGRARRSPS